MRMHPVYAYDLLSHIAYLHTALDIPYCHHEKWDGSGYPRGLKRRSDPTGCAHFCRGGCVGCINLGPSLPPRLDKGKNTRTYPCLIRNAI